MRRDPLPAGLYIVATPIGNLRDVTLRALDTLAGADLIACEDTRVTAKLLAAYGLKTRLTPYHDHNAAAARPKLLDAVTQGRAVALVSDAGTPLISDPGYKLVAEAAARGLPVIPIPGASAALAALAAAGLPSDRFLFAGFPPSKAGARRAWLADLAALHATLILYEAPSRLAATLADLAALDPERPVAVMRELTKRHEEHRRGSASELSAHYAAAPKPKGEIVLVLGPPAAPAAAGPEDLDRMLADALTRLSLKDAAAVVAQASGRPRKEVYARALALKSPGEARE
ncbi:MAG: 16S rRNA (cytidine(1402)-2'-O)-methyltransferase [Alphaproteobacteria bacterium]|nr:16S rRNA (cytidine(1402)-2'-O)-methyltransferase [Alphaproteobacteria bacterium]